ncbi:hypothetical protein CSC66_08985 [Pseudoxanthomonas kaohsiungensis]|nr:hypothetical protein CSC66_08985 [Pseudoxanthomonas kaohsiungensis]
MIDDSGAPVVVYHGTHRNFEAFHIPQQGASAGINDVGAFFSSRPDEAGAGMYVGPYIPGANLVPAYLSLQRPKHYWGTDVVPSELDRGNALLTRIRGKGWARSDYPAKFHGRLDAWVAMMLDADAAGFVGEDGRIDGVGFRRHLEAHGYDGILLSETRADAQVDGPAQDMWIAFRPEQVKSVVNCGAWDAADPRIAFKRGGSPPSLAWLDRPQLASAQQEEEAASVQYENQAAGDAGYAPADELRWLIVDNYPVARLAGLPDRQWWEQEQAGSGGRWSELESQDVILPVVIMDDGQAGHVWDGYHRATATVLRGKATLPAIVGVRPELLAEAFPEMEEDRCSPKF